MTKRALNQNGKYVQDLLNIIEPDFIFDSKPINRSQIVNKNENIINQDKQKNE